MAGGADLAGGVVDVHDQRERRGLGESVALQDRDSERRLDVVEECVQRAADLADLSGMTLIIGHPQRHRDELLPRGPDAVPLVGDHTDEGVIVATFDLGLVDPRAERRPGGVLALDDDALAAVPDTGNVPPVLGSPLSATLDPVIHVLGEVGGDLGLEAGAGRFRGCAGPAHAGTAPALVIPASQTRSS